MKKKGLCILIMVLIIVLSSCGSTNMNSAYKCCKDLRSMCYDPTEFTLYDDVACIESDDGQLIYITFGATRKNGSGFKDIAIYCDEDFKGLWSYDESDFSTQTEYDLFLINYKLPYEFFDPDEKTEDSYSISGGILARRLNVEHIKLN